MKTRLANASDVPSMRELVPLLASPSGVDVFAAKWLVGFPRADDRGTVAVDDDDRVIGAAWFRPPAPGNVPELVMAVELANQGSGIGQALLGESVAQAREMGLGGLQVALRRDNWAVRRLLAPYVVRVMHELADALDCLLVLDDRIIFRDEPLLGEVS